MRRWAGGLITPEEMIQDALDLHMVRYMMRCPVSLKRLRFTPGSAEVVYTRKGSHDTKEPSEDEKIDAEEFVARVLVQIPEPRRHLVRY